MARGISLIDQAQFVQGEANKAMMSSLAMQEQREQANEQLKRANASGMAQVGSTLGGIAGTVIGGGSPIGGMLGAAAGGLISGLFG